MKASKLTLVLLMILSLSVNGQKELNEKIVFSDDVLTFKDHPGLEFKLSEPFLRYQKWDTEKSGDSWFSIALEFTNNSEKPIRSLVFQVKILDKNGNIVYNALSSTGPMTFLPSSDGKLEPGYKGIYDSFISKAPDFINKFKKVELTVSEINYALSNYPDKPEFTGDTITFTDFEGLCFVLSEPYMYTDDLSGNDLFAVALKFINNSGKELKFMNFKLNIFDEIGLLYERENQENNQRYEPGPINFMNPNFPVDYEGINKKFFVNEISLFEKFKKIEIQLISIE